MRIIRKILLVTITTATVSAAAIGLNAQDKEKSKEKSEQIKLIGEPERCIKPRNISSTYVIDRQTIEFRMHGNKIYRNNLERPCPGLSRHDPITYQIRGSELCSVDIFTVLNTSAGQLNTRATCGFGKFQQIEKIKAKKKAK